MLDEGLFWEGAGLALEAPDVIDEDAGLPFGVMATVSSSLSLKYPITASSERIEKLSRFYHRSP